MSGLCKWKRCDNGIDWETSCGFHVGTTPDGMKSVCPGCGKAVSIIAPLDKFAKMAILLPEEELLRQAATLIIEVARRHGKPVCIICEADPITAHYTAIIAPHWVSSIGGKPGVDHHQKPARPPEPTPPGHDEG